MNPGAEIRLEHGQSLLFVSGEWTARQLDRLHQLCAGLGKNPGLALVRGLDLSEISALDPSGAFLLNRLRRLDTGLMPAAPAVPATSAAAGQPENITPAADDLLPLYRASHSHKALLDLARLDSPGKNGQYGQYGQSGQPGQNGKNGQNGQTRLGLLAAPSYLAGEQLHSLIGGLRERLSFLGAILCTFGRACLRPASFRLTSTIHHMDQAGVQAIPIVCLLSFLIGMVLAYMSAAQMATFGMEIFVVKLLEIGVMREMAVIITAILVAGRSGSSFTAQIGSMLANQEIDAMRSMGIDPMPSLVLPRVLALVIMLPALVLLADIAGMAGGLCAVWMSLDISPQLFVDTLQRGINFNNVLVGLIKAPFFALVVGGIGCFTGFKAGASADSVGRMTTRAVVESIFLVITLDAMFALFFSKAGF